MQFGSYPLITTIAGDDTLLVLQDSSGAVKQITSADFAAISTSPQGVINVKWFGAKGDGVTDDTISVQNAINSAAANQAVYFPPSSGAYIITSQITFTKNNLTIFGYGAILKGTSSANYQFFQNVTGSNFTVFGLVFDGTSGGGGGTGSSNGSVQIFECSDVTIRDCRFINTVQCGILVSGGARINIHGNIFTSVSVGVKSTFSTAQPKGVRVENNSFQNSEIAIRLSNTSDSSIVGNSIDMGVVYGSTAGISIDTNSTKIAITANALSGSGSYGIAVSGTSGGVNDVAISGNTIKSDGQCIDMNGCYAVAVVGNVLAANSSNAGVAVNIHTSQFDGLPSVHGIVIKDNVIKGTFGGYIIQPVASIATTIYSIEISSNNTADAIGVSAAIFTANSPTRILNFRCFNNRGDTAGQDATINLNFENLLTSTSTTIVTPNVSQYSMDATGGAKTVTLPTASQFPGLEVTVLKTDVSANAVTVVGTINGAANYGLAAQYKYVTVISNGTDWHVINKN